MGDLEPITVRCERLNAPHAAHPREIISWLQSICSEHEPTGEFAEPRVLIDDLGILVTWTTKGPL